MRFPKRFKQLKNGCIAAYTTRGPRKGKLQTIAGTRPVYVWEGEDWKASRLSYHLNVKNINSSPTKRDFVLHTCDNHWCINPKHLYLGTLKQNSADTFSRNDMSKKLSEGQLRSWTEERKRRHSISLAGNRNAFGKRWKLSAQSRKNMSEAAYRRWARIDEGSDC